MNLLKNRTVHSLVQGSPEWLTHRTGCRNASDAAAAQGLSEHMTRTALLNSVALGSVKEASRFQEALRNKGHEFEDIARGWAEEIIGDELYPVTISAEIDGIQARLSASMDGLTMSEDTSFEHKSLNQLLRTSLGRGEIPAAYKPQLEQQLLLSGASRSLFMASSGDRETMLFAWYESDPQVRADLLAAWKQFEADLVNYKPVELPAPIVGKIAEALPALIVRITGKVEESNLAVYRDTALAYIKGINRNLETDQDFADAANNVKFCEDAEKTLKTMRAMVLGQVASIDEVIKTIGMIETSLRDTRLALNTLVEAQKQKIKNDIRQASIDRFAAHIAGLNERLGENLMPAIPVDFGAAMKNKRNLASLHDAVDTLLANKKIEANEIADRIQINLRVFRVVAADHLTLFPDLKTLVLKLADDFRNAVEARIAAHLAEQSANNAAKPAVIADLPTSRGQFVSPVASVGQVAQPTVEAPSAAKHPNLAILENVYMFASDSKYTDAAARKAILDIVTPFIVTKKAA